MAPKWTGEELFRVLDSLDGSLMFTLPSFVCSTETSEEAVGGRDCEGSGGAGALSDGGVVED